jgi:hypothetical protein
VCLDPTQQFGVALASGTTNWLLAWHDSRNGPKDVYGIRVGTDGEVEDPQAFLISRAAGDQSSPTMAFDGTNFLAVWHEWKSTSGYDIRGVRLDLGGVVLDPAGIAISTGTADEMYPAIDFDGTNFLVTWQDDRGGSNDIYGARVTSDGTVLDASGIPISAVTGAQEYPALAFDGSVYLVVWQDKRGSTYDIYASRVTAGGTVLNPAGIVISNASRDQAQPAVAFDGANHLVVWHDARNVYNDIYGSRVTSGGMVLDSSGIAISSEVLAQECPALAYDGTNYAVTWQDRRDGSDYEIYLSRVTVDGTVVDSGGVIVSDAADDQLYPAIVFNNRQFLVVWQDIRGSNDYDIYGARVDQSGTVLDPSGLTVSSAQHDQVVPALCSTSFGQVLIAYSSFTPPPAFGSYRIWGNYYDLLAGLSGRGTAAGGAYLSTNFPNPFTGSTTIRFYMQERGAISLAVYDVEGRLVTTLMDGVSGAGMHELRWDTGTSQDRTVAPGLYFYQLRTRSGSQTRKMIILE